MLPHRVTAVSPRQRHGDLATHPAGADQHRVPHPVLEVKNLQPLTDQRVERVRDDNETQIITGRRGTTRPPSAHPTPRSPPHDPSVSPPPAPGPADSCRSSSGSTACRGCPSPPAGTRRC